MASARQSVPSARGLTTMRDEDDPPPPSAAPASRLNRTLHSLRQPFRSVSPFHIAAIKRTGSNKSTASESEATRDELTMRKKNKKQRGDAASDASGVSRSTDSSPSVDKKKKEGGGFVRRIGSLTRRKGGGEGSSSSTPTPATEPAGDCEPLTDQEATSPESPASPIAVEHAVSIKPFTKAAWMRKSTEVEMEKPIEEPSPENAQRRRLTFSTQASTCMSEDRDEEGEGGGANSEVGSLEELVALARVKLLHPAAHPSTHSQENDTEEEHFSDAMPPYGDLMAPEPSTSSGGGAAAAVEAEAAAPVSHAASTLGVERREHLYKILVIGELGTGKTSIIKRYVHQFFSQHYRATIGVDFALKVLNWDANTVIRLQLWDIAGQERFGNMTRVYYKEAVGAFIVFDVSRSATFDAVVKWKNDLDSKVQLSDGNPIPCILLANKCDQQKEGLINQPAKMDEYCREKGFAGWFETSAKENVNIEEAARSLVNKILLNDKLLHTNDKDGEGFSLEHRIANGENGHGTGNKSCAC